MSTLNRADVLTEDAGAFLPNIIFTAAYAGALFLLIARGAAGRSRTWLLLPILIHVALRLTSHLIFALAAKQVAGVGQDQLYSAQMCWLPALTIFVVAHCIATALYIAKGPYQERVRFGQLPMSMRAAFISPHVLLLIAGLAGLYQGGNSAYTTNDAICLIVLVVDCGGTAYYCFKRRFLRQPAYLLLGTASLLIIAAAFRIATATGAPGTVYPTQIVTYFLECAPLTIATYLWLVLKIKKVFGLGGYANSVMAMPVYETAPSTAPLTPYTPASAATLSSKPQTMEKQQTLASRRTRGTVF